MADCSALARAPMVQRMSEPRALRRKVAVDRDSSPEGVDAITDSLGRASAFARPAQHALLRRRLPA